MSVTGRLITLFVFLVSWGLLTAGNWEYVLPVTSIYDICPVDSAYWIGTDAGSIKLDPETGNLEFIEMKEATLEAHRIYAIQRGLDGKLWVVTGEGLALYDGYDWEKWDTEKLGVDPTIDIIGSMLSDECGNIWVCYHKTFNPIQRDIAYETILCRIGPDGVESSYYDANFWMLGCIDGKVYAATDLTSLDRSKASTSTNDQLYIYDCRTGRTAIRDLNLKGHVNHYWLAANGDLFIRCLNYDTMIRTNYMHRSIQNGVDPSRVKKLTGLAADISPDGVDENGNIFSVSEGKPLIWRENGWEPVPVVCELPDNVSMKTITPDGKVLASDGHLLYEYSPSEANVYNLNPTTINLANRYFSGISDMVVDSSGNAWFATKSEISRYDGRDWYSIYISDRLGYNEFAVSRLEIDSRDNLWLGFNDNLYHVRGDDLVFQKAIPGLIEMAVDSKDQIWLMCEDRLLVQRKGKWNEYPNDRCGLSGQQIRDFYIDSRDRPWVETTGYQAEWWVEPEHFIYSFDGNKWAKYLYDASSYLRESKVTDLYVDEEDRLWIATSGETPKVLCYHRGKVTEYPLDSVTCVKIFKGANETWWANVEGGSVIMWDGFVIYFDGRQLIRTSNSPETHIRRVYLDKKGNNWLLLDSSGLAIYNESGVDLWN